MSWRVSTRGTPIQAGTDLGKAIRESVEGTHSPDGFEATIGAAVAHHASELVRHIGQNLVHGEVAKQEEVYSAEHAAWRDELEKKRAEYNEAHPAGTPRVHGDEFVAPPEPKWVEPKRPDIVAVSAGSVQDPAGKTSLTIVVSLAPEG